jgi:hypothetical protein
VENASAAQSADGLLRRLRISDGGIDWSAGSRQALTLPVGIDVGKVTRIGRQHVSFQLGAYDALKSPAGTAQWIIRAQITLLFAR